jgi:hypothetical protein
MKLIYSQFLFNEKNSINPTTKTLKIIKILLNTSNILVYKKFAKSLNI